MPAFTRRGELAVKLVLLALALGAAALVFFGVARTRPYAGTGAPRMQPIPFSHKHHVGDDGIDCRYCHTTVETAAFAGLPSTGDLPHLPFAAVPRPPLLAPLHGSAASGRPIAWTRVHMLPDFVYFNHSMHVAKGVGLRRVPRPRRPDAARMARAPLQMQWCLDCHRDPAPHLRAPDAGVRDGAAAAAAAQADALARGAPQSQRA